MEAITNLTSTRIFIHNEDTYMLSDKTAQFVQQNVPQLQIKALNCRTKTGRPNPLRSSLDPADHVRT